MYAAEFKTTLENDVVHIPDTLKHRLQGHVKIIILKDTHSSIQETESASITQHQQRVAEFMQFIEENHCCVEQINIPDREARHAR
ncbi:MAG: hypothetical protein GY862_10945 [Gammaproteobacteria bacterium]|nr:hypothetical protein [Gammaproteobacteria bacterium]